MSYAARSDGYVYAHAQSYTLKVGQNVSHRKFGHGVVLSYKGAGVDTHVQINFCHGGEKWLSLEYAKLQAV